ncbi:TonB-dependent receptor [Pseudochryseolinea flava]|uniref:TonB-dependent receptor n=1 Tax=Pseudochryseolinea flava TaxID=2059302 RepID=A0A364Y2M1_9BACT|nr:TonB-dependent receptor [Pseudochryseolinea flava]RAW00026.1 TonB-dependent receptor [Pseudochryseolinea flava]
MNRLLPTIIIVLLSTVSLLAQQISIKGTVTDEQNTPVPFASTALYNLDSALVTGTVSDETGSFTINTTPGSYYLKVTFLAYQEKTIGNLSLSADVNLGNIVLQSSPQLLNEVEVVAQKSSMELQLDKRVFNVGQDLSNAGGSASDVLSNIPSVSVDVDGSVSLRGSENVRILIDGKPSGLILRSPDALKNLQGNMIERVEVITNPSSRYDAAGEVGIINIVLKKNKANGINGTFTLTGGIPALYGGSYSINVRQKNINFFSSYGASYRSTKGYSRSYQDFPTSDTSYTQNGDLRSKELSHNITGGLDYYINDFNTLTGSLQYNWSDGVNNSKLTYNDFQNGQLFNTVIRTDREEEDEENIEGSINYRKTFEQKGREFTLDYKYIKSVDAEHSNYLQQSTEGTSIIQRGDNDSREKNWLIQSDYIHPIGNSGKIESGLKTTTRVVDNDYALENQDNDGEWTSLPAFNNNMVYTERIHAGYVMAGNKFGKVSAQAGLRGEYSDIKTELTETNDINHREYFNLFPSVNLGYEFTPDRTFQLSYSYRINRPEFRDLLPFSNFTDSRVFFVGNPNLNPEYTHAYETSYLLNWEGGSILSSLYYRARKGVIQRINELNSDGTTFIIPVNLATQDAYGFEFNLSLTPTKWWQVNTNANLYRAITEGKYQDETLYSDTYTMNGRVMSKLTFQKAFEFQASFNYNAPRITTQGKQRSSYSLDLAASRDILKGKGTLTANVRDLLNTRLRRSITDIPEYYSSSTSQRRGRQFAITFTYRLNRVKDKERKANGDNGGDMMED